MSAPRVALCVVTYNSAPLVADLVASLPVGAADTDWILVVADNASSDDTVARVRQHAPDAVVVETGGNLGYAAGVNAAIRAAGEQDAYLILNADVRLLDGCVATLFDALSPTVGIAVPQLLDAAGRLIWSQRREPTLRRAWADALIGAERAGRIGSLGEVVTDPTRYDRPSVTEWAEGSTQLVSAECVRVCGEWDESYFLYSEETEYDLRAGDRGLRTLYVPTARATHLEGGSAGSPRLWSLLVANRVKLYRARHAAIPTFLFWSAVVAREASRALFGKATSRSAIADLLRPSRLRAPRDEAWLKGVKG